MTTTRRRRERQELNPDLGLLATQLNESIQLEVLERLRHDGHPDLRARHTAVLAYLDEDGVRASDLVRLTGRHKQVVGRLTDELEELGYVTRKPDPGDRRAKLILPTERGLEQMRLGDGIVAEIERRHAESVGPKAYADFRNVLRRVVARERSVVKAG